MRANRIIGLSNHTIEQQERLLGEKSESAQEPARTELALNDILGTRVGEETHGQEAVLVGDKHLLGPQPALHLLEAVRVYEIAAFDAAAVHEERLLDGRELVVDERVQRARASLEAGLRERRGQQRHDQRCRRLTRSFVQLQVFLVRRLEQDVLESEPRQVLLLLVQVRLVAIETYRIVREVGATAMLTYP